MECNTAVLNCKCLATLAAIALIAERFPLVPVPPTVFSSLDTPKNTLWVLETEALCGSAQPSNHVRAGAAGSDPIERACAVEKLNDEFIAIHDRGLRLANDCANGRVPSSAPQKHPSITNGREVCRLWIVVSHRNGCGPPRIIASGIIACPTFFASDWLVAVTMISRGVRT